MRKAFLICAVLISGSFFQAHAALRIVCTTASLGALARAVAGPGSDIQVLAPSDRDTHSLVARPSMMAMLRRADLLVVAGADLEQAWIGPVLEGAANARIMPGKPGYFDSASFLNLIDSGEIDRAKGDVHPQGNPHFHLDPVRMAVLAIRLGKRIGQIDPPSKGAYEKNARNFAGQLSALKKKIIQLPDHRSGVIFYHKDGDYLARLMNVKIFGYVERLAGVPPTPGHLLNLIRANRGKKGIILRSAYYPEKGSSYLAAQLKWPHRSLPLEPAENSGGKELINHIFRWAKAIAGK